MNHIIESFEIPTSELENLKKSLKNSKKAISLIEETERKYNEVKKMMIDQIAHNPNLTMDYIDTQLKGIRKFTQLLLRGDLKGVMVNKIYKELMDASDEITTLHGIIKQKNEEIELYKEKCNKYYNMIEENDSNKKELEEIKIKYEKALEGSKMNLENQLKIAPNFNMSLGKEENFVEFIQKNLDGLAKAKKIRENSQSITYEINKNFIDNLKNDKRKSPKINKNDVILVTKNKN